MVTLGSPKIALCPPLGYHPSGQGRNAHQSGPRAANVSIFARKDLLYHDCIKTRANFQTGQGGRCGHISDEMIAREPALRRHGVMSELRFRR